jgi:lipoprotein-anchoring transpeptidase ErfK/SrfK
VIPHHSFAAKRLDFRTNRTGMSAVLRVESGERTDMRIGRRAFVIGAPFVLAGCASGPRYDLYGEGAVESDWSAMYGPVDGEPFPVPAVDLSKIDPAFLRREVAYSGSEAVGSIIVDPNERHAYLIMQGGRAMRYGVGVGRTEAFNWQGEATIGRKAQWPRWTPTRAMIEREPERYGAFAGGMAGGPSNPLGPRALYLYSGGRDTYYRLHGTTEPWTIGTMVSSGCVRFINQDIIDLYRRVPVGTKVVVLPSWPGYFS